MTTYTDYEKTNTRKSLEKSLDYHESLLAAWQQVTRNYKKDGSSFAALAKNFNNLSVNDARYSLKDGEKELTVCTRTNLQGYISESISNRELKRYTDLNPDESRIIDVKYLEPYFFLTPDEISRRIEEKKAYHSRRIEELKKALADLQEDDKTMETLLDTITAELAKINPDTARIYKEKLLRNYY